MDAETARHITSHRIVEEVLKDLRGRKRIGNAFDEVDPEIMAQLREDLAARVRPLLGDLSAP